MAYTEKYYLEHISIGGVGYRISLQKNDYSGNPIRLKLAGNNGLQIDYKHDGWFKPLIGQTCSLNILNDSSNWYDLEDIATLDEKEFKIVVNASLGTEEVVLFNGFINSNVVTQKYLENSIIKLTASNYISKLNNTHPIIIDEIDRRSILDVINDTLKLTGKSDNIRLNCSLDPSGATLTNTRSCFNTCAVDTEVFWENNIDKNGGEEILESLLIPFDCYLYWWNEKWYIQRYADVWVNDGSKYYIEYSADLSYGYSDDGSLVNIYEPSIYLPISSFTDKAFTGGSQSISMIPGLQFLEINAETEQYINLTGWDLAEVNITSQTPTVTYPKIKGWDVYASYNKTNGIYFPGYQSNGFFEVSTGYNVRETYPFLGLAPMKPGNPYKTIGNAIYRYGWPARFSGGVFQNNEYDYGSLSTRFRMTINNEKDFVDASLGSATTLNIKFKYASIYPGSGGFSAYDHRLIYWLRVPPGNRYIVYEPNGDYWKFSTSSSFKDVSCHVDIGGSDFNPDTGVAEVNIDIPIGDVSGWTLGSGDFELIWGITSGDRISPAGANNYHAYNLFAYYGDFRISANSGLQNNRLTAEINNKVLNKETVNLKVFDVDNLNYRNGIFYGSSWENRTTYWTDKDALQYYSLQEWLIHDRFQLYNRNRRKIDGTLKYAGFLKPFSMWVDTYDPSIRKYLLTDYTYNVGDDTYKCSWLEYDNSETINLNY